MVTRMPGTRTRRGLCGSKASSFQVERSSSESESESPGPARLPGAENLNTRGRPPVTQWHIGILVVVIPLCFHFESHLAGFCPGRFTPTGTFPRRSRRLGLRVRWPASGTASGSLRLKFKLPVRRDYDVPALTHVGRPRPADSTQAGPDS
jgi:hypothetical protein